MNKKAFEMSFAWIFAIIAGISILFLAIYGTTQAIKTRNYEIDTQTSDKLAILLNPLETSMEFSKSSIVRFGEVTKIFNDKCYTYGNFGQQSIGISSGEKEQSYGKPQYNKYIFSQNLEQGKEFIVFSKPFFMPFKVADSIFFSGRSYCFVKSPEDIKDELLSLGVNNAYFTDIKENCSEESEKVCFNEKCDISVYSDEYFNEGYVIKNEKKLYYSGSLIYGAIFSSPDIYKCNVKRLMMRLASLCILYKDETRILAKRNCYSPLDSQLDELASLAKNFNEDLSLINEKAEEINGINDASDCRIF